MNPVRVLLRLAVLAAQLSVWAGASAADVFVPPPEIEARSSPSGAYSIEIKLRPHANAHAARALATLFELKSSQRQVLWTRELPHRSRPRYFAVGDGGQVVFLDEWLNLRSELAVMVVDRTNRTLAQFDLEAVRAVLAVPIGALAQRARNGVWMQAPPQINAAGDALEVAAADRLLSIRFSDGAISVR